MHSGLGTVNPLISEPLWFVYLIECRSGKFYCGITNDLIRRWNQHLDGAGAKFTRSDPPVEMLGYEIVDSKSAALKRERAIKDLNRKLKIALVRRWQDEVASAD